MTDERETATELWQDRHGGKRGHQLMTQKLAATIPAIGATENVADYDDVLARAKLFSPYSNWNWYITEWDAETGQCFGLVEGLEKELGYFDLIELAETTAFGGVPAVERDLYWEPKTLGEIKNGFRRDSPHNQETDGGEAMTDETGREIHSPDVLSAEEFLFGHATNDAPADIGGGLPAGDETEEAGGMETAGEPDAGTETAEEPGLADDAGEQTAPGEMESSEELKVVVSIRGGRAIIGVQQPSSDPHIEVFDDADLTELAQQVAAVVDRARAKWENEPRYPAHEKPAPPARRRGRRQQETAQASDAEEGADQQQPETLRLF